MPPPLDPRLLALLAGPRTGDSGLPGERTTEPSLDSFALQHLGGYGSVDAPSPWGYDRDVFTQEHPGYQGGFYNPTSGFYDAPTEVAFQASGPDGPATIGTGSPWEQSNPGFGQPYSTPAPQEYTAPTEQAYSAPAAPQGASDGQGTPSDQANTPNDTFDLGSFMAALAAMGDYDQNQGAGDHDSSNVSGY